VGLQHSIESHENVALVVEEAVVSRMVNRISNSKLDESKKLKSTNGGYGASREII
jgi:hypothetical protein